MVSLSLPLPPFLPPTGNLETTNSSPIISIDCHYLYGVMHLNRPNSKLTAIHRCLKRVRLRQVISKSLLLYLCSATLLYKKISIYILIKAGR